MAVLHSEEGAVVVVVSARAAPNKAVDVVDGHARDDDQEPRR